MRGTTGNVLLIGSGGREHAIANQLSKSSEISRIFVSPGNAGTATVAKTENVKIELDDNFGKVAEFCSEEGISLVVVGPEDPLAAGIADSLQEAGIPCFGPSKAAAQIEASKAFSKDFMRKHEIATAKYQTFTNAEKAKEFIRNASYPALVIKADGLAAGKGVVVAGSKEEACRAVDEIKSKFGPASQQIVVEELLEGPEVSALCFTDGKTVKMMPMAQDNKRLLDGDQGANTGGMGAICPYPVNQQLKRYIEQEVLIKTIAGLREDGIIYRGVLYAGLMLTSDGPKVLEFNCRFGDPETQAILSLLKSDLLQISRACTNGSLSELAIEWDQSFAVCGIVLVSKGYPGAYEKGLEITGFDRVEREFPKDVTVFHAGTKLGPEGKVLTSGGRVLGVFSKARNLEAARIVALNAIGLISFDGAFHRKDIGLIHKETAPNGLTYESAGVSISNGNDFVEKIKPLCKETTRIGCRETGAILGSFGATFDLRKAGYDDPITVITTDGVGTKLDIALESGKFESIGQDLVAMCVNDLLCEGAEPVQFLDYFATGKLLPDRAVEIVRGIAEGCKLAGCSLAGGETAEMPGLYRNGQFDLAGFALGVKSRAQIFPDPSRITWGSKVFALRSSGVHSNGFSLVRKLVSRNDMKYSTPCPWDASITLGQALLEPTKIYVKTVLPLIREGLVSAAAHITGGGLIENIPRVLPPGFGVELDASLWEVPEVFEWIQSTGQIVDSEMWRTFNCGIGMVLIVPESGAESLRKKSEDLIEIGSVCRITEGQAKVTISNWRTPEFEFANGHSNGIHHLSQNGMDHMGKKKVAIFISGTGTNMEALIEHTKVTESACRISLVVSDKEEALGLKKAQSQGISIKLISIPTRKDIGDPIKLESAIRTAFKKMSEEMKSMGIDLICLAGFMRIVPAEFTNEWKGKLLNVHPSLLPKYRGLNTHQKVLDAREKFTGCTVHFVRPEVDAGPTIDQARIVVRKGDTVDSLSDRIKVEEHRIFPLAMEDVASGIVRLNHDWTISK